MASKKLDKDISPDRPQLDPLYDELGFAPFAEHLAKSFVKMKANNGMVLALNGAWGSGKTTIINYIVSYIKQFPKKEQPVIVYFNPWLFTGDEKMLMHFFKQLQVSFEEEKVLSKDVLNKWVQLLELLSDSYDDVPSWGKFVIGLLKKFTKASDIEKLRQSITSDLKGKGKKILVIIDDIDRLTSEEIRQIFRIIKAVADFPNVVYLLAFDKKVVVNSLKRVQEISGEEYLEKIIQAPFDVPLPEKGLLNTLFVNKLNVIITDAPKEELEPLRWQDLFFGGVEKYISTPRNAMRLFNALSITYPAVMGEINIVDLVGIETIRVFCPTAYDIIRNNKEYFVGTTSSDSILSKNIKELKEFHEKWISELNQKDKQILQHILPVMFPKLKEVFGGYSRSFGDYPEWRLKKRIADTEIFPVYFGFVVSRNNISSKEIETIVKLISDERAFSAKLLKLTKEKLSGNQSKAKYVLDRLRDYAAKKISKRNIKHVVNVFFDIGDELLIPEDEELGLLGDNNENKMGRIIWQLLKRQDKSTNYKTLKNAINNGRSLTFITREIGILGQQHGKNGGKNEPLDEQFLTLDQLNELEIDGLHKIRTAAEDGTLLKTKDISSVLYRWLAWTDNQDEVKTWCEKAIKDDSKLLKILSDFLRKTITEKSSGTTIKHRLDPEWLKQFMNVEKVIPITRKLKKKKGLTGTQKMAINTLLREYKLRKQGKNPDSFFN